MRVLIPKRLIIKPLAGYALFLKRAPFLFPMANSASKTSFLSQGDVIRNDDVGIKSTGSNTNIARKDQAMAFAAQNPSF